MKTYSLPVGVIGFMHFQNDCLHGPSRQILQDDSVVIVGGTKSRPLVRTNDGYLAYCDKSDLKTI